MPLERQPVDHCRVAGRETTGQPCLPLKGGAVGIVDYAHVSSKGRTDARCPLLAAAAAGIAVQNSINIPPSLRKAQGSEVSIFVAQDFDFSGVYGLKNR